MFLMRRIIFMTSLGLGIWQSSYLAKRIKRCFFNGRILLCFRQNVILDDHTLIRFNFRQCLTEGSFRRSVDHELIEHSQLLVVFERTRGEEDAPHCRECLSRFVAPLLGNAVVEGVLDRILSAAPDGSCAQEWLFGHRFKFEIISGEQRSPDYSNLAANFDQLAVGAQER